MWSPPEPIFLQDRQLTGHEAWVHVFVQAWQQLDPSPEALNVSALHTLAAPLPAQFANDDPAAIARRLYGKRPDWEPGLYPV